MFYFWGGSKNTRNKQRHGFEGAGPIPSKMDYYTFCMVSLKASLYASELPKNGRYRVFQNVEASFGIVVFHHVRNTSCNPVGIKD